jgi:ligand-binding sensor domain-containing protein
MIVIFLVLASHWTSFLNSSEVHDMVSYGNNLLIGTTGGALIFNKQDTSFTDITNVDGLLSNDVVRVEIDKYGNFWFLCAGEGITVMSQDRANVMTLRSVPSYSFSSICMDGDTVWVGTDDDSKIWRYDMHGNPFTSGAALPRDLDIDFLTNEVNDITIMGDSVWFGTARGIAVTSRTGDSLRVYDVNDGLPSDTILAIGSWGGYVWAGTDRGTARRTASGWEIVDSSYRIKNDDTTWIEVYDFCWTYDSFWEATSFGTKKWEADDWTQVSGDNTRAVLFDSNLWLGTFGKGIVECDGGLHAYVAPGPAQNRVSSLAIDTGGEIWLAHSGWPVSKLFYDDEWEWKAYNEGNYWGVTGWISTVTADREGNVWMTTWDWTDRLAAIKVMPNDSISKVRIDGGVNANVIVSACTDDREDLWVACADKYIRRISNNAVDTVVSSPGITAWVMALAVDMEGNLWVGDRDNGLVVLSRGNGEMSRISEIPSDETKFIKMDQRNGEIWVGTATSGVYRLRNKEVVAAYSGLNLGGTATDMTIDGKGRVWFAITDVGIKQLQSDGTFRTYDKSDGLVNNDVTRIRSHQDVLWIGTEHGLSRFNTEFLSPDITQMGVYPNPLVMPEGHTEVIFDSKDLKGGRIRIYTISGALVRIIEDIGSSLASWDARNSDGEFVGSGIYIFVIETEDGTKKMGKIAVVR